MYSIRAGAFPKINKNRNHMPDLAVVLRLQYNIPLFTHSYQTNIMTRLSEAKDQSDFRRVTISCLGRPAYPLHDNL